jgi:hypothetical protein
MKKPYFSEAASHEFGAFYHHLGLVRHSMTAEVAGFFRAAMGDDAGWGKRLETGEMTRIAFEATSLFHEVRHLYDAFGTLAGISLFGAQMSLLKSFCVEMHMLRREGLSWSLPLAGWAKAPELAQARRDFVRRARAIHSGTAMFLAAFKPVEVPGHIEELVVKVDGPGGAIDAFPLRFVSYVEDRATPKTVLCPLGFETFMEGNAHAVARNLVGSYFPPEVADELLMAVHVIDLDDEDDAEAGIAGRTPPYMVVDLLISRFLRAHGVEQFPRNIVFGLIDIVLSQSWLEIIDIAPGVTGAKFDNLGGVLVDVLGQQSVEDLATGKVTAAPEIDAGYRALLDQLEKGGDWDTVEDDLSPLSSMMIWESYCAQHLTVPLLRARLASDHAAFRTHEGFAELLGKFGQLPVSVVDGGLRFNLPERVVQAWGHVTMIASILHQLLDGRERVDCPRRAETVPGIHACSFVAESDCANFIRTGCGRFEAGIFAPSPPCHFEDILRRCGLARDGADADPIRPAPPAGAAGL